MLFQSRVFRYCLAGLGTLAILLIVFSLGVRVGYRKAFFSYRWGENYHRNFAGPRKGFFQSFMRDRDYIEGHGTTGTIVRVDGSTIIVKGADAVEKIVHVSEKTIIRRNSDTLAVADLRADDRLTILGMPSDNGQIDARFIRVFPKQ